MPSPDLATLVAALKRAEEGHVITPDYHNSIVDLLEAIVAQLTAASATSTARSATASFPPALVTASEDGVSNWTLTPGVASVSGQGFFKGWMAVALPDGATITRLRVQSTLAGTAPVKAQSFVNLVRQAVSGDQSTPKIAGIKLEGSADVTLQQPADATSPPLDQALTKVDNAHYKYFVLAQAKSTTQDTDVAINAIQIDYQLG